jgi:hypothetical protein
MAIAVRQISHPTPRSTPCWRKSYTAAGDSGRCCWRLTGIWWNALGRQGCPFGGRLHCANYPCAPRGGREHLPDEYRQRFSFCCERDGCSKRLTPPSVRFLGRNVYLDAVVVLISAVRQGPTPRRVRELSRLFGVDRATIARWQTFWRDRFPQTPFWKIARARLVPVVEIVSLPYSLVDGFLSRHPPCAGWVILQRFLSPITTRGAPVINNRR